MAAQKRILIIDDDDDFTRAVGTLLGASGYAVLTASTGRDGLDLAKKSTPDLILLDVMMTERTEGFFTLQQLRSVPSLRQTPIIVVSSIYTDQPGFRVSPEAGWLPASLFLAKPVDPACLLEHTARLLSETAPDAPGVPLERSAPR